MTIKKPALRYELNLNTIVQLVGFALLLWAGWGDLNTRVKALEEQSAKEEQRVSSVEVDVRKTTICSIASRSLSRPMPA
jgi:hypothetical protein